MVSELDKEAFMKARDICPETVSRADAEKIIRAYLSSIAERAEGEAVAWRWREHYNAARDDRWHLEKELPQFSYEVEIQPLFTHPSPSQVAPANPAQVTDAQIEHMVQQFLRWKLPDDFAPDGGIQFVKRTDYGHTFEPVGTNLFDYRQAKAMVQHMLEGLPAIGAGGQAVAVKPLDYENIDIPTDIREFGERHRIPEFSNATYRNGYVNGYRFAVSNIQLSLSQPHPADERVVEALREAHSFIAREYRDEKSLALEGEFVSKEARPVFRALSDALSAKEGR